MKMKFSIFIVFSLMTSIFTMPLKSSKERLLSEYVEPMVNKLFQQTVNATLNQTNIFNLLIKYEELQANISDLQGKVNLIVTDYITAEKFVQQEIIYDDKYQPKSRDPYVGITQYYNKIDELKQSIKDLENNMKPEEYISSLLMDNSETNESLSQLMAKIQGNITAELIKLLNFTENYPVPERIAKLEELISYKDSWAYLIEHFPYLSMVLVLMFDTFIIIISPCVYWLYKFKNHRKVIINHRNTGTYPKVNPRLFTT